MARTRSYDHDDKPMGAEVVIESNWEPMRNALIRKDWFLVTDLYRGSPKSAKHALHARATKYLNDLLALEPTKEAPFRDDQGLNRLIYMVWPTLPIKIFDFEDLPTMMQEHGKYNRMYREGQWLQSGASDTAPALRQVERTHSDQGHPTAEGVASILGRIRGLPRDSGNV